MPTFKSVGDARITAENWCQAGIDMWTSKPDDPALYYALEIPEIAAWEWLGAAHSMDADGANGLLLQSVSDLAALMPAGQPKTDMEAIAAETADLAALKATWLANRKTAPTASKVLVNAVAVWLTDQDRLYLIPLFGQLIKLQAGLESKSIVTVETELLATFKSRYDVNAFTAGGSYT